MTVWIAWYVVAELLICALALAGTLWIRRRRRRQRVKRVPEGYVQTDEVFIDPTTGVVHRVWFHQETGERFYQPVGRDCTDDDGR
ncbi:MAG: hypothetical protein K6T81_15040 [Alicyclobacillus macrosporangiidus]|uniref:hypothetical protein n=1 Tax=Alicyclobacillus macrosporangiidus TaxID=392015 RepID=UPI0026EC9EA0|nr:hypothetical protein [Alicyclobacillus macrosporangiidus]MCL6600031.1 hypothetical protein [Alicyclobacillus macrosporangiidus]